MPNNSILNVDSPSPRWYRKAKRVIGLASGPAFMAFFEIFEMPESTVNKITKFLLWLPTLLELLSAVLNDDLEIAPAGTKAQLQDIKQTLDEEPGPGTIPGQQGPGKP